MPSSFPSSASTLSPPHTLTRPCSAPSWTLNPLILFLIVGLDPSSYYNLNLNLSSDSLSSSLTIFDLRVGLVFVLVPDFLIPFCPISFPPMPCLGIALSSFSNHWTPLPLPSSFNLKAIQEQENLNLGSLFRETSLYVERELDQVKIFIINTRRSQDPCPISSVFFSQRFYQLHKG